MQYKIFGCKVNKYYLNKRINYLKDNKLDNDNVFLIASCEVTDRAKSKRIKELKDQIKNGKKIYITGCGVLKNGKLIESDSFYDLYPELSFYSDSIVLLGESPNNVEKWKYGKMEKWRLISLNNTNIPQSLLSTNVDNVSMSQWKNKELYTKKFIVIQNGCDNFCSFCLTILKRWKSRNISMQEILDEINEFEKWWWKEIVLTWINLASRWCLDTKKPEETQFSSLLKKILSDTKVERIRISSLWPEFLNDDFFSLIENKRFLPHFHISVQSFSDKILKSMNRNYDSKLLDKIIKKFQNLKRDDIDKLSLWADLIVGFPWETDEDFKATIDWVQKYQINKIHAFPFSAHQKWETIPAGKFPFQVPQEIKKDREKKLIQMGNQIRNNFLEKNKWKNFQVLIEEKKDGKRQWRTENYIQVQLDWDFEKGELVELIFK